jgi:hypothetical protein
MRGHEVRPFRDAPYRSGCQPRASTANKHAQQLWTMLAHDLDYDPHACVKHPIAQRPASEQAITVAAMA